MCAGNEGFRRSVENAPFGAVHLDNLPLSVAEVDIEFAVVLGRTEMHSVTWYNGFELGVRDECVNRTLTAVKDVIAFLW